MSTTPKGQRACSTKYRLHLYFIPMRKDLDNRITPHESVILLCQDNPEVVKSILGFAPVLSTYASLTAELRDRLQKTETTTRSLTMYKNNLKESLMVDALRFGTKMHLSSIANDNVMMMESIYTKKKALQKQGEEPMIARMKMLVDRAINHEKELMELGVTPDQTKTFSDKISAFENLSGEATRKRQSRASSVDRVEDKLTNLRAFFVQQIEPFITSEAAQFPDFYAEFLRKKRIVQSRSSKKQEATPVVESTVISNNQSATLSEQLLRSIESVVHANSSAVGLAPSNGHRPGEVLQAAK
jgi:hypothetical protein